MKLPDELKVKILEWNLVDRVRSIGVSGKQELSNLYGTIMYRVRLTPDIGALSKGVSYGMNCFLLSARNTALPGKPILPPPNTHPNPSWYLAYPGPSVCRRVCRVRYLFYINSGSWG
jgi:hypothetical protein